MEPPTEAPEAIRDVDLVLARLHLRLGSLSLARAELEALAGRDGLDQEGILDLAEVRWRTGDLAGAGEAAAARLEMAPDDVVALVIAAEAQADLGRPGEARRLASLALALNDGPIDPTFAGMPRSAIWPVDPGAPIELVGEMFTDLPRPLGGHLFTPTPFVAGYEEALDQSDALDLPIAGEAAGQSLWEAHDETIAPILPDPVELLARARIALGANRPGQAAVGLALALRSEPSFAPAVLDLLAGRQEPVLALVRGDANRIVGQGAEALRDYAMAVGGIDVERRSDGRPIEPEPDEAPARSRRRRASASGSGSGGNTRPDPDGSQEAAEPTEPA